MADKKPDFDVTNDEVDGPDASVSVGGYDVFRTTLADDAPGGIGTVVGIVKVFTDHEGDSGPDIAEVSSVLAGVADLGFTGWGAFMDPLNYLISSGLGFLIDVVQPLEDLLGLVTGNGERMAEEAAKWERVGAALQPLAQEIRDTAKRDLAGWSGDAGAAANAKIEELAKFVEGIAADVVVIKGVLDVAAAIMNAVQAVIISLLSMLIEWLVIIWLSALAAAVPTAGASTAAAAATAGEVAVTSSKAAQFVQKASQLLTRLNGVMKNVGGRMAKRALSKKGGGFTDKIDGTVADMLSPKKILQATVEDYKTYVGPVASAASGVASSVEAGVKAFTDEPERGR